MRRSCEKETGGAAANFPLYSDVEREFLSAELCSFTFGCFYLQTFFFFFFWQPSGENEFFCTDVANHGSRQDEESLPLL